MSFMLVLRWKEEPPSNMNTNLDSLDDIIHESTTYYVTILPL